MPDTFYLWTLSTGGMMVKRIAGVVMALSLAGTAVAQNLAQREMITQNKAEVAEHLAAANKTCGSNVKLTVDYSTFADVRTAPENDRQQDPWTFAANATDAMANICRRSEDGKTAIQTTLKLIVVMHAKAESEKFENGTFTYSVPYTGGDVEKIVTYLKSVL